jgi:tRNA 2-thiouridine synthesizing protein B
MGHLKFYVLAPDMQARGLDESNIMDGVEIVDYAGFVDLATAHNTVQAWL